MKKTTAAQLDGQKFGKLTVLRRNGSTKNSKAIWLCQCECGNQSNVVTQLLLDGRTKSCGCLFKFEHGIAAMNALFTTYKTNAKKRNIDFVLEIEDFCHLTQQTCHYCGIPLLQITGKKQCNGQYIYNGIDRLDNKLSYNLLNCVSCCKICNFAKGNKSYQEFLDYVQRLSNHLFHSKELSWL